MAHRQVSYAVAPVLILDFLRKSLPFSELDSATREAMARTCMIRHYAKGTVIVRQDVSELSHLHIIQQGGVKLYLVSEDAVVALSGYGGEGESFGALSIIRGERPDFNVESVEDTFCFLIDKDLFLEAIRANPRFARFYMESLSEDLITSVYTELRCEKVEPASVGSVSIYDARVSDVIRTGHEIVESTMSIRDAAVRMAELRVACLLVRDQEESVVGMVTDKDLRTKVVAEGLDYATPVEEIMTSPMLTIPARAPCFEALLRMIREPAEHLAVEHRKRIVGVISIQDLLLYQGASPLYLSREIEGQRSIEGLYLLCKEIPGLVRTLLQEGARAGNITRMITLFSDRVLNRILFLLGEQMGPPPVPYCWLNLGSLGRKEQVFQTDQDNALVYWDPATEGERQAADSYFQTLTTAAVNHLEACGYPKCRNRLMASNPRWRVSFSTWESYFDDWFTTPVSGEVALGRIFFDFRPAYGYTPLGQSLRTRVIERAHHETRFLGRLAANCLASWPPLALFRDSIVEKDGEHSDRLDLKERGLTPFVNFARLMALRHGIDETNTLARIRLLGERGHLPQNLASAASDAYEFLSQLSLVSHLCAVDAGLDLDYCIRLTGLSDLERKALKESFAVIDGLLAHIINTFEIPA